MHIMMMNSHNSSDSHQRLGLLLKSTMPRTQSRKRKTPPSDSAPPQFIGRVITPITWTDRDDVVFKQPETHVFYNDADFRAHVCQVLFGGTMEQCKAMLHSYECMEECFPDYKDRKQLVHSSDVGTRAWRMLNDLQGKQLCFNDMQERWFAWFQQQPHCAMATDRAIWKALGVACSMFILPRLVDPFTSLDDIIDYLQIYIEHLPDVDCRVDVMVSEPSKGKSRFFDMERFEDD